MCRFLFAYRRASVATLEECLARLERPFRHCRPELSYGVVALGSGNDGRVFRSATPPACQEERLSDLAGELASHSPILVHMRKRVGAGDSLVVNTHPFVWGDRYLFMHNGRMTKNYSLPAHIERQIQGQTDSERFLALWMSLLGPAGLRASLKAALAVVEAAPGPPPLINLVLLDKATGEFVVYRGRCPARALRAVYVDVAAGLVANFRPPGAAVCLRKGQMLYRPRWGARVDMYSI
jgi:hypothetical protein